VPPLLRQRRSVRSKISFCVGDVTIEIALGCAKTFASLLMAEGGRNTLPSSTLKRKRSATSEAQGFLEVTSSAPGDLRLVAESFATPYDASMMAMDEDIRHL